VAGLIPKLTAARLRRARPPEATFVCIYREQNFGLVLALLAQAEASRWAVRLWALDEVHPELARHTVGRGPAGRFELWNRLVEGVPGRHWVVIADDDCRIAWPWTLATFLTVCRLFGFDLAQPAHVWSSHHWTLFNEQKPGTMARDVTYVESGPIVAISPRLRPRMLPIPISTRMGGGEDVLWTDFVGQGYRLGIADGVPLEHLAPMGLTYDTGPEYARCDAILAERGLHHIFDVMATLAWHRWLPFRRRSAAKAPLNCADSMPV
jgi:hypothetical protein